MKKEIEKQKIDLKTIDGLQQTIKIVNHQKKTIENVPLHSILTEKDVWQTNGRVKKTLLTHDAVKKLADFAGVAKAYENRILTQPDAYNNQQYTWEIKVCMLNDTTNCAVGVGEANRSNLGSKGRGNPANMAEKRAYDRAVFRLLGITGLLSEEELSDEEHEENMDGLTHDDKKKVAPMVNQLLLASTKDHLAKFNVLMKTKVKDYTKEQLEYLRKLYKKRFGELQKTSF